MGCCLLAATTPILHQNTSDQKTNCFVSSGKEQIQILTTQIQNQSIGKKTAKNPCSSRLVLLHSFLGKRGGKEDTRTNAVWPPSSPPGGEATGRFVCPPAIPSHREHSRPLTWRSLVPRHIPTFYCLFPVTGRHRRERAACHSKTFLNLQFVDE
jgi:hypothetical protein